MNLTRSLFLFFVIQILQFPGHAEIFDISGNYTSPSPVVYVSPNAKTTDTSGIVIGWVVGGILCIFAGAVVVLAVIDDCLYPITCKNKDATKDLGGSSDSDP